MIAAVAAGWAKMKVWLIAAGSILAAIGGALLLGKTLQKKDDQAANEVADEKANAVVAENLTKIAAAGQEASDVVSNLPPVGPQSASERLHNEWSADDANSGP